MKRRNFLILLLCACPPLFLSGCFWANSRHDTTKVLEINPQDGFQARDLSRFNRRGNILILPFTAGEGVMATGELEKTVLMFIKGAADQLSEGTWDWTLASPQDESAADLVVRGRVIEFYVPRGLKSHLFSARPASIKVKGFLTDPSTKEEVARFSLTRAAINSKMDTEKMGYSLGQEFIEILSDQVRTFSAQGDRSPSQQPKEGTRNNSKGDS